MNDEEKKLIANELTNGYNMGHENIIKYYSHFVEEGFLYILQEYAEGGSLFDYLLPNNPLDEEISIKMVY